MLQEFKSLSMFDVQVFEVDIHLGPVERDIVVKRGAVTRRKHPWLLFETGLPTRYYLPKHDVRLDLLEPSETVSRCPCKGEATTTQ
jgi:uncharacterized protein (DUF427 family)